MRKAWRRLGGQFDVALDHAALQLDGRAHRLDGAAELDQHAVADRLDDAAMEALDDRRHQLGEMRAQIDQRLLLVGAHHAAVAVDVREQDGREPPVGAVVGHRRPSPRVPQRQDENRRATSASNTFVGPGAPSIMERRTE